MKAYELIEKLKGKEDFDIKFAYWVHGDNGSYVKTVDVTIDDIGYSSKIINLGER